MSFNLLAYSLSRTRFQKANWKRKIKKKTIEWETGAGKKLKNEFSRFGIWCVLCMAQVTRHREVDVQCTLDAVVDLSFFTEFRFIILTHLIFGTIVRRFVNFSSWCFMPMASFFSSSSLLFSLFCFVLFFSLSRSFVLLFQFKDVSFVSQRTHFGFYAFSPNFIHFTIPLQDLALFNIIDKRCVYFFFHFLHHLTATRNKWSLLVNQHNTNLGMTNDDHLK